MWKPEVFTLTNNKINWNEIANMFLNKNLQNRFFIFSHPKTMYFWKYLYRHGRSLTFFMMNLLFLSSDRHHISSGASGPSSRPSTPPLTLTSLGKQLSQGTLISLAFIWLRKFSLKKKQLYSIPVIMLIIIRTWLNMLGFFFLSCPGKQIILCTPWHPLNLK